MSFANEVGTIRVGIEDGAPQTATNVEVNFSFTYGNATDAEIKDAVAQLLASDYVVNRITTGTPTVTSLSVNETRFIAYP